MTNEQLKKYCIDAVIIAHQTIKRLGEEGRLGVPVQGKLEAVTKADLGVLES